MVLPVYPGPRTVGSSIHIRTAFDFFSLTIHLTLLELENEIDKFLANLHNIFPEIYRHRS